VIEPASVQCPSCGEPIELTVDTSVGTQTYYEDCSVCCRPMAVRVLCRPGEVLAVEVRPD
jgi:Cysteine-rich CPXCG